MAVKPLNAGYCRIKLLGEGDETYTKNGWEKRLRCGGEERDDEDEKDWELAAEHGVAGDFVEGHNRLT
jgi:hypothetical protein